MSMGSPRRQNWSCLWAACSLVLAGCASRGSQVSSAAVSQPTPSSAIVLPPELDRVLREYEAAWRASDPDALAALFAVDGFILPNQNTLSRGRDAIRAAYADNGGPLFLEALDFETAENVAWIIGIYGHEENGLLQGKFILALTRDRASDPWLIAGDIDNTSRPRSIDE